MGEKIDLTTIMKWIVGVLAAVLVVGAALAAEETKPLDELQSLKIKVLILERQVIEAQAGRVQCQAAIQYQEKGKALDSTVEAAAKMNGVDLKDGWQPDIEKQIWIKK